MRGLPLLLRGLPLLLRGLPLLLLLAASDAWGARDGMLPLVRPGFQAEETALMQGLRIYTQDLEIPFKTGSLSTRGTSLEEDRRSRGRVHGGHGPGALVRPRPWQPEVAVFALRFSRVARDPRWGKPATWS